MAEDSSFQQLIGRVRRGDEQAAAELVRRYQPAIRRAVRFRLTDRRLRRTCDSMDVCQSVLLSFFVRAASGQYDLDTPEQLLKLLTRMACNKALNQKRHFQAFRRDGRLNDADVTPGELIADGPCPSRQAEARELLDEVHRRLSDDERRLVELRNQGHDWAAIAAMVGGTPVNLRQKLHRALARLTRELGLEEVDDG
jgi:RNA polymerase sigma-70 factor (ECF subfamily)